MPFWTNVKNHISNHKKIYIPLAVAAGISIGTVGIRGTGYGIGVGARETGKWLWKGTVDTVRDAQATKYKTLRFGEGKDEVCLKVPEQYEEKLTQLLNAYKGSDSEIYAAIKNADMKDGKADGIADVNGVESLVLSISAEKGKRRVSISDQ